VLQPQVPPLQQQIAAPFRLGFDVSLSGKTPTPKETGKTGRILPSSDEINIFLNSSGV